MEDVKETRTILKLLKHVKQHARNVSFIHPLKIQYIMFLTIPSKITHHALTTNSTIIKDYIDTKFSLNIISNVNDTPV